MFGHRINGHALSLKSFLPKAALPAGVCAVAFLTGCLDMNAPESIPPQQDEVAVSLATTTTKEAESATRVGAIVAKSNSGYHGTGYVDYQNPSGDYIDWSLGTLSAGSYTVTFRYANGSKAARALKLTDGGTTLKSSFSFAPTGSWTTWKTVSFTTTFSAAGHHVRATAIGQSGPNIDYLQISGPGGSTGTQRKANLTWFTSYPAPGSEECIVDNGCAYEGLFAALDGRMSLDWVKSHNIISVHERDFSKYKLKTFHITQSTHVIDAKVYDECADSDCDGCCTKNAASTGFLIDMETFTTKRFGSNDGIVNWVCTDCN